MINPNRTGFTKPIRTSGNTRICQAELKYWRQSTPKYQLETTAPPVTPRKSEITVRKKSMNTVATTRGPTSFFMGSVPSARMASICSVTTIDPSSLAIPDVFRPATIRLVSTGPSSRTMEVDTSWPTSVIDPKRCNVLEVCSASTAPVKKPVNTTIGSEPTPIKSAC